MIWPVGEKNVAGLQPEFLKFALVLIHRIPAPGIPSLSPLSQATPPCQLLPTLSQINRPPIFGKSKRTTKPLTDRPGPQLSVLPPAFAVFLLYPPRFSCHPPMARFLIKLLR